MTDPIPRLFVLRRDQDVTGVSGPGDVADGVQWPDGTVALRWRERPSTSLWDSLDLMLSVHGHDGRTRAVWLDEQQIHRARIEPHADRPFLEDGISRALVNAAQSSTWGEEGIDRWTRIAGDHGVFVNAVMETVDQLLDQRDRAQRTAGRAYKLADRWKAAHGQSAFLVRAAGAELRDELDDDSQGCGGDARGCEQEPEAPCPHCPDGHQDPAGGSQPWAAWVGPERDGDGQPTTIHVARTAGAHIAASDARWVREVLNTAPETRCTLPHEMEV